MNLEPLSQCTVGQDQVILRHQKFTFPRAREWASKWTSERSGGRERSELSGASKWVSGASERSSKWPSTYVPILGCSAPLWKGSLSLYSNAIYSLPSSLLLSFLFWAIGGPTQGNFHPLKSRPSISLSRRVRPSHCRSVRLCRVMAVFEVGKSSNDDIEVAFDLQRGYLLRFLGKFFPTSSTTSSLE